MSYYIRHKFQTGKGDGPDSTRVRPTNWNDDHLLWLSDGEIIGKPPGSGDGPAEGIPISSLFPAGMVVPYAGGVIPGGWLVCDGRSLVRATYPALFTTLGTFYGQGAAPGTTFNIPYLYGRTIAMVDPTGTVLNTNTMVPNGNTLGAYGGQQQEQVHIGNLPVTIDAQGLTGQVAANIWSDGPDSGGTLGNGTGQTVGYAPDGHRHVINMAGTPVGIAGQAHGTINNGYYTPLVSNVQPTMLMWFIIKS